MSSLDLDFIKDLKVRLGIEKTDTTKDDLLMLLVIDTREELELVTNVPHTDYPSLVRKICVIEYNKLGSEGLSSETYSGASQNFLNDLPSDIVKQIRKIRKLKF